MHPVAVEVCLWVYAENVFYCHINVLFSCLCVWNMLFQPVIMYHHTRQKGNKKRSENAKQTPIAHSEKPFSFYTLDPVATQQILKFGITWTCGFLEATYQGKCLTLHFT